MNTSVLLCAVVDKYGFLWTGSGAFLYGGANTYSVLRFDTTITTRNDAAKPILAFTVVDESNVRSFLWPIIGCMHRLDALYVFLKLCLILFR